MKIRQLMSSTAFAVILALGAAPALGADDGVPAVNNLKQLGIAAHQYGGAIDPSHNYGGAIDILSHNYGGAIDPSASYGGALDHLSHNYGGAIDPTAGRSRMPKTMGDEPDASMLDRLTPPQPSALPRSLPSAKPISGMRSNSSPGGTSQTAPAAMTPRTLAVPQTTPPRVQTAPGKTLLPAVRPGAKPVR